VRQCPPTTQQPCSAAIGPVGFFRWAGHSHSSTETETPMADHDRYSETNPRNLPRSLFAISLGLASVVALSLGTDQVLHVAKVYPPWGQSMPEPVLNLLALSYRLGFGALGSFLAARLSPRNPMRHAMILGVVGFALSLLGAVATIPMHLGPSWYPMALVVTALPMAWLGGILDRPRTV